VPVYGDRSQYAANQGDVFEGVPFAQPDGRTADGMIVAHDCVCDKFLSPAKPLTNAQREAWMITMAPVHPIDQLTGGRPDFVREDKMPRYFYLPAEGGRPELVADLWLEQPVRMLDVMQRNRLTSLSPEWLARLWEQFMRLRFGEDYKTFLREVLK
jgi:hypothetical protein